jgi:hypothetical protein
VPYFKLIHGHGCLRSLLNKTERALFEPLLVSVPCLCGRGRRCFVTVHEPQSYARIAAEGRRRGMPLRRSGFCCSRLASLRRPFSRFLLKCLWHS